MSARRDHGPSQRPLRVGEEIRHALAAILARGELRDPALQGVSITVSEVRMSPDLRNATAYVMPLGGAHRDEVMAALKRAAPFLRAQIAHVVRLRYAPELRLEVDTSFDYAQHIDALLHSERVARDLGPSADGDSDEPDAEPSATEPADDADDEDADDEDADDEDADDEDADDEDADDEDADDEDAATGERRNGP